MAKIVFFSSSHRALPAFRLLQENMEVVGVVSQPDRPVGHKAVLAPTAISQYAQEHNIPLLKPEKLDQEAINWIADKKPDVLLLSYYGLWIPPELFDLTPTGILATHPSLLPQWRWGSPVQATILSGRNQTGVTLIKMDEKFDHGPIVAAEKEKIRPDDNQESLYTRLFTKGAELAIKTLPNYLNGKIIPQPQDHTKATFAKHITRDDGFIPPQFLAAALQGDPLRAHWEIRWMLNSAKKPIALHPSPVTIELFIRAMSPWPGAWTHIELKTKSIKHEQGSRQNGKARLKILKAHLGKPQPTTYTLQPDLVQLEGKKPVSWKQFKEAYPDASFLPTQE